jgi:hypothetical protein
MGTEGEGVGRVVDADAPPWEMVMVVGGVATTREGAVVVESVLGEFSVLATLESAAFAVGSGSDCATD